MVRRGITASGLRAGGSIALRATGDVDIGARLVAKSGNEALSPGTITVEAEGAVRVVSPLGRISAKGRGMTAGGEVALRGGAGVDVGGRGIDASGASGGSIELSSLSGGVSVAAGLDARGRDGQGGVIAISAGTDPLSPGDVSIKEAVSATGASDGGVVTISAPDGNVSVRNIRADGRGGVGGTVTVTAGAAVVIERGVRVSGFGEGGSIAVSGESVVFPHGKLSVKGQEGAGGTVSVIAGSSLALTSHTIEAEGGLLGGYIAVAAPSIQIADSSELEASGREFGGTVEVVAASDITYDGDLDISGRQAGGFAFIVGGTVRVGPRARFVAEGDPGSEVRVTTTAGDLTLNGRFNARSGGIIEGQAFCNLTATGDFRAAPSPPGCIGLSAGPGWILDITGASLPARVAEAGPAANHQAPPAALNGVHDLPSHGPNLPL